MRLITCAVGLLLFAAALPAISQQADQAPTAALQVEDFEAGIGRWFTNDDEAGGEGPAKKCAIHAVSGGAPGGRRQSARVEFYRNYAGWASVSLPVEGRKWAELGANRLSMWIRGDGSEEPLRIVLRVQQNQPARDEAYSQVIRLDGADWERFSFRFFGFKDPAGRPLDPEDVQHIRLLQFAKNGAWQNFRFRVDEIAVDVEAGGPDVPAPDAATPGRVYTVTPDFGRPGTPALAQIGLNLGEPPTVLGAAEVADDTEATVLARGLISDLAPTVVRFQFSDYYDADREVYTLGLLRRHLAAVERLNCRPLVCLDPPRVPDGDPERRARVFQVFVRALTDLVSSRAGSGVAPYYEILDEPMLTGTFTDIDHVVTVYNTLADLVLAADPRARVGGPGFSSAWHDRIRRFLSGARRLDFLSFHFYGTHNVLTDSASLFEVAYRTKMTEELPNQLTFQEVKRLIKELRTDNPEVFVTEFALSSARDERGRSRDERAGTGFGAAWLATAVLSGTPYVDKVLFRKLAPGGWGMISHDGKPETPYWAAWLLSQFAPRGATFLQAQVLGDFTVAAAFRTRTAHNVIIAHGSTEPVEFRIVPSNLPPLEQVRRRSVADTDRQWTGAILPLTTTQNVLMNGPGVMVVQYIPRRN